ncbi:hypothetical protein PRIPAC_72028 [Pristionchus pacificus]|uniref:Uncharacterized protein n=1 Tax=Pristionchus pacificus TaxID=54126 RepID=A0A2A6BG97_PRIPA|nr:hypothetical protein PRIPAC_72028 [Pristionchus pacificus]|eukprot:PDM64945.1 hypothetical protein PRIPAC_53201 [Pristionchus pacificus]
MINLQKRIKGVDENKKYMEYTRICIREKLLTEEVKDLERTLAGDNVCRLTFPSPGVLHEMHLTITPNDGFYKGGIYHFDIKVPAECNNVQLSDVNRLLLGGLQIARISSTSTVGGLQIEETQGAHARKIFVAEQESIP